VKHFTKSFYFRRTSQPAIHSTLQTRKQCTHFKSERQEKASERTCFALTRRPPPRKIVLGRIPTVRLWL
jgi:hypothetical protein